MNEGIYYQIDSNRMLFDKKAQNERKEYIRNMIASIGFISHMELVSMSKPQKESSDYDSTEAALFELQQSGEIRCTYTITDQQNVIVCYKLSED